jgi:hypothetical protein
MAFDILNGGSFVSEFKINELEQIFAICKNQAQLRSVANKA